MKKNILLVAAIMMSLTGFAQFPGGGFGGGMPQGGFGGGMPMGGGGFGGGFGGFGGPQGGAQ
ncbi:MAG: hypothetical protein IKZ89_08545, partial [Bacteroidaceae bacterium]|nr:hypothetical protein [Bacteroidaceae bacterium]